MASTLTDNTFTGATSNSWATITNWSLGRKPISTDNAIVDVSVKNPDPYITGDVVGRLTIKNDSNGDFYQDSIIVQELAIVACVNSSVPAFKQLVSIDSGSSFTLAGASGGQPSAVRKRGMSGGMNG